MEAEAAALRIAITSVRRLGYAHVTFCGDLQSVYGFLQKGNQALNEAQSISLLELRLAVIHLLIRIHHGVLDKLQSG